MSTGRKSPFLDGFSSNFARKKRQIHKSYAHNFARAKKAVLCKKLQFARGYFVNFERTNAHFAKNRALGPSILVAMSFTLGIFLGTYAIPVNSTSSYTRIEANEAKTAISALSSKSAVKKADLEAISAKSASGARVAITTAASNTASTPVTPAAGTLKIPSIGVSAPLQTSTLSDKELSVPGYGVSFYGSLYMAHSSGVFARLGQTGVGQQIYVGNDIYTITSVMVNQPVWGDRQGVGAYSMGTLTNLGSGRIVLMTCSGVYQEGFGWTTRTLVFATKN